jgi:hypothetical protein
MSQKNARGKGMVDVHALFSCDRPKSQSPKHHLFIISAAMLHMLEVAKAQAVYTTTIMNTSRSAMQLGKIAPEHERRGMRD